MDWLRILKLDSLRDVLAEQSIACGAFAGKSVGSTGMGTYIFGFEVECTIALRIEESDLVGSCYSLSALGLAGDSRLEL